MTAQELDHFLRRHDIPAWLIAAALDPPINERQIRYWRRGDKRIPPLRSDQFDDLRKEVEAGNDPFADITRNYAAWDPNDVTPITGKGLAIGLGIVGSLIITGLYFLTGRSGTAGSA